MWASNFRIQFTYITLTFSFQLNSFNNHHYYYWRGRFRCSNWLTATGCWYTNPLQTPMDDVRNFYSATHSAVDDTNCISMWTNISKQRERPPFIHSLRFALRHFVLYRLVINQYPTFCLSTANRSHSIASRRTATTIYHCFWTRMDIQHIVDPNSNIILYFVWDYRTSRYLQTEDWKWRRLLPIIIFCQKKKKE